MKHITFLISEEDEKILKMEKTLTGANIDAIIQNIVSKALNTDKQFAKSRKIIEQVRS